MRSCSLFVDAYPFNPQARQYPKTPHIIIIPHKPLPTNTFPALIKLLPQLAHLMLYKTEDRNNFTLSGDY